MTQSILVENDPSLVHQCRDGGPDLLGLERSHDAPPQRGSVLASGRLLGLSAVGTLPTRVLPKLYFLEQLRREMLRANRINSPLSLALFCIEKESHLNHNESKTFVQSLQNMTRETDILAYLSKNVIALLLPDTDEGGTQELMKKIINNHSKPNFLLLTGTYPDQLFDTLRSEAGLRPDVVPFFLDEDPRLGNIASALKRGVDIIGSLIGLAVFLPLMLMVAMAIKLSSPGPVIFKQIRVGRRGVPFVFYKFRSMYQNVDEQIHQNYIEKFIKGNHAEINQGTAEKPLYKMGNDPRVTWIGRIIRVTSIDELPQLFNVLKGEMSLVGPRPPLTYEVKNYQAWHLRRIFEMKPGITGLWQVSGRSEISFDEMVRLDLLYARSWSIMLDLKLLIKTVKAVVQCKGAA